MSLTKTTYAMISGAPANVRDYGAKGDGLTDDTTAIQTALNNNKHVVVPIGAYLISSTISVPETTKLEFLGGDGNSAVNAAAYFIKKSTMTTWGLTIGQAAVVTGGGLLGQTGNTGGGVWLFANAAELSKFWIKSIGGYGVKVGADAAAQRNCNSTLVDRVFVSYCTDHGILIDDDYQPANSDANAGTVSNCVSIANGGSGIYVGSAWWVSVLNCNCEINTGWGLYLSGVNKNSYPACRWATIIGGDYNEGNVAGVVYDASYFSTFVNPDANNLPTTSSTGLQGSALRNYIGSQYSVLQGLTTENYANTFSTVGGVAPIKLRTIGTNIPADGAAVEFYVDPGTGSFRRQGRVKGYQLTSTEDGLDFAVNNAGALIRLFLASTYYSGVTPAIDNTYNLGHGSFRWNTVYATTGTINTSDANQKQQIRTLTDAERAVAKRLKSLIRAFKFNDAVAAKGDAARVHIGVIAQNVKEAFEAEGLDADQYGMFCSDTMEDGSKRLGVRYEELLAFVIAAT